MNSDFLGDSIDVRGALAYDNEYSTRYMDAVISDLEEETGLSLRVEGTRLVYDVDENGYPVVSVGADGNIKGSPNAARSLINAINNQTIVHFRFTGVLGSEGEGNRFNLDVNQVQRFINGASPNLNPKTMGFGMTFLHELLHTSVGFNKGHTKDEVTVFGSKPDFVVGHMNLIRKELGKDYGQRMSYLSYTYPGEQRGYLPFDIESGNVLVENLKLNLKSNDFTPTKPSKTTLYINALD